VEWTATSAARSFMLGRDRIVVDTNYFVRRAATWTVEVCCVGLGHLRTYNIPDTNDDRAKNASRTIPRRLSLPPSECPSLEGLGVFFFFGTNCLPSIKSRVCVATGARDLLTALARFRIGTRFLASREATIHPRYREHVLKASETDTVFVEELFKHRLAKRTASRLAQQNRGSLGGRRMPAAGQAPG
jgi:hypothetical protein